MLLGDPWRFQGSDDLTGAEATAFDDRAFSEVKVPHTWGREKTWRSAWYRTRFAGPASPGLVTYLSFEGVSTIADVYVNGHHLGQHRGAYTRFVMDATPHVAAGENVIAVRVSDDPRDTVDTLPSGAGKRLYYSYGGIYRKAWVVHAPAVHVDPTDHAASGVFITARNVTKGSADLAVRTLLRNETATAARVTVHQRLTDADGREAATFEQTAIVPARGRAQSTAQATVRGPRRWSPADPHLYRLHTELRLEGQTVDAVTDRTGLRDFRLLDGRFVLNGAPVALRGIGKHQETERNGTAVTDDELREDFANLRDLGVNTVRLAHYPHAELEYDLADELGIMVWAENGHSNANKTTTTGDAITREMIRQNYNHPSIVMWSVGNETAFVRVNRFAAVAREEDPSRPITYASNTGGKGKQRYPDLDFIAHNTYRGWYRGMPWEFEEKAVSMRYIAENGAGAVISNHTDYVDAHHAVDAFEPEEYRQVMAEVQLQTVFRDHAEEIPMYLVWILRDFAIDKYKGRNTKGLLTYANHRKDPYYLYKAFLRPDEPVVHITSKTYFLRQGRADNGVKVYSNRPALTLTVNGVPAGHRRNGDFHHRNGRRIDNVFYWPAALREGRNDIAVADEAGHRDETIVHYAGRGRAESRAGGAMVGDLRSSNPKNPAFFIDAPVQPQWPFYWEFDGTADNTFDRLPDEVQGAGWIATRRISKPGLATALTFTVTEAADVFVMASAEPAAAGALEKAGLAATPWQDLWRDDELRLVPCRLFRRAASAGETVRVPALTVDAVVLVRPRG